MWQNRKAPRQIVWKQQKLSFVIIQWSESGSSSGDLAWQRILLGLKIYYGNMIKSFHDKVDFKYCYWMLSCCAHVFWYLCCSSNSTEAGPTTFLSICTLFTTAYTLVTPCSPMNINTNTNSFLANYPRVGMSIWKGEGEGEKWKHTVTLIWFPP